MPYGTEKPITQRTRVVIVSVLRAIGMPFFIGLSFLMGWWVLVLVAPAIWATRDYVIRGDFFGGVDQVSKIGGYLAGGLGHDDDEHRR